MSTDDEKVKHHRLHSVLNVLSDGWVVYLFARHHGAASCADPTPRLVHPAATRSQLLLPRPATPPALSTTMHYLAGTACPDPDASPGRPRG